MTEVLIERLDKDTVLPTYPLIREVEPRIDLRRWTRFARRSIDRRRAHRGGILVARRIGRPFPCGLVVYRLDRDLLDDIVLTAEYFVAVDAVGATSILAALVRKLESVGRDFDCRILRSVLQGSVQSAAKELLLAGHEPGAGILLKVLDRTDAGRRDL